MGRLVDDLLRLSRIGRTGLVWETASLRRLVDQAIEQLDLEIGDRQVTWKIGQLPEADCDAAFIAQLFVNLLSNAVKYTRPRKVAVIEIDQTVADNKPAIFVRDNGVGFNMQYVGKVFQAFQRLHRADQFEGTGIGLAIALRIIQKHRGEIWAESTEGEGTTFYFTLPGIKRPNTPDNGKPVKSSTDGTTA
jgi:light-regulated signal transduction histidine kinase (bacteriophytochrome)